MAVSVPSPLPEPFLPLHAPEPDLQDVGGKAVNLSRLARAGFPVPNGFFIPTDCYRDFVNSNQLASEIGNALGSIAPDNSQSYEAASELIRAAFQRARIDPGFVSALELAWRWLGAGPVAVRSSATAEDLPGASFAGQQDTFLNVVGETALPASVVNCWSSVWTARAISYRDRNGINHEQAALAIVVQDMVPAAVSGVMFTSNPVSGLRTEVVVDATLGLGEALVSGLVEPDHYVVAKGSHAILARSIGSKAVELSSDPGGGVRRRRHEQTDRRALSDEAIRELTGTGQEIERLFGFPQDVEWAYQHQADQELGRLSILQSRPITSLYPVPAGLPLDPPRVMFSFGAVQGLMDPMTPLGQDAVRLIFSGGGTLFGSRSDHTTQGVIRIAGERLWGDVTGILRHPVGARALPRIFAGVEPGSQATLNELRHDPTVRTGSGPLRPGALFKIARFILTSLWRVVRVARKPEDKAAAIRATYQAAIDGLRRRDSDLSHRKSPLDRAIILYRELEYAFVFAVPEIALGAAAGLIPLALLSLLSKNLSGTSDLALHITRGLPHNVTTEMDLELWNHARAIQNDPDSRAHFARRSAAQLGADFLNASLPSAAQNEISAFLETYGMRGVGEIDIGRPRWREDPTSAFQTLKSYIQIDDPEMAPDAVFQRGREAAAGAVTELAELARGTFAGGLKATLVRAAARRVRALGGLRESPKFYIIQVMGIVRMSLQGAGAKLTREGILASRDDIFFLYLNELEEIAGGQDRGWKSIVANRREEYQRELLRRQIPRILLSDGRAYYQGIRSGEGQDGRLRGSPVSPGLVEGTVRVVRDPHNANLRPGEILVCPGTDPAWTPLFLAAGGLVMEVGGMMTHGAIVAREYGIPAVVGVDQATEQLQTGQRVRVDGSSGVIERLGQPGAP